MKAILVIDMPMKCFDCKLYCNNGNSYWCIATNEDTTGLTKPINCPLKPMPEKVETPKIIQEQIDGWHKLAGEYIGYNACINEILGEK